MFFHTFHKRSLLGMLALPFYNRTGYLLFNSVNLLSQFFIVLFERYGLTGMFYPFVVDMVEPCNVFNPCIGPFFNSGYFVFAAIKSLR